MCTSHHSGLPLLVSVMKWSWPGTAKSLSASVSCASVRFGYNGFSAGSKRVRSMLPGWSTHTRVSGHCSMFMGTVNPSGTVMYSGSVCPAAGGAALGFAPPSHALVAVLATVVSQKKPLV